MLTNASAELSDALDIGAVICTFQSFFFGYQASKSRGGQSGQFSLHLSHQEFQFWYIKPLVIVGQGSSIYIPHLLINHNAQSTIVLNSGSCFYMLISLCDNNVGYLSIIFLKYSIRFLWFN